MTMADGDTVGDAHRAGAAEAAACLDAGPRPRRWRQPVPWIWLAAMAARHLAVRARHLCRRPLGLPALGARRRTARADRAAEERRAVARADDRPPRRTPQRAPMHRALGAGHARERRLRAVHNGEDSDNEALGRLLFDRRYLLSPAVDAAALHRRGAARRHRPRRWACSARRPATASSRCCGATPPARRCAWPKHAAGHAPRTTTASGSRAPRRAPCWWRPPRRRRRPRCAGSRAQRAGARGASRPSVRPACSWS
jgi:hypothetical protein